MDPSWTREWPPGRSEDAGEWVARRLAGTLATARRYEAAAVAQALYVCTIQPETPVRLTIAISDQRLRITSRPAHPISDPAARAWDEQAGRLADRHGKPGDTTGLWAEFDLEGTGP
jgi:hypothetical protein